MNASEQDNNTPNEKDLNLKISELFDDNSSVNSMDKISMNESKKKKTKQFKSKKCALQNDHLLSDTDYLLGHCLCLLWPIH